MLDFLAALACSLGLVLLAVNRYLHAYKDPTGPHLYWATAALTGSAVALFVARCIMPVGGGLSTDTTLTLIMIAGFIPFGLGCRCMFLAEQYPKQGWELRGFSSAIAGTILLTIPVFVDVMAG